MPLYCRLSQQVPSHQNDRRPIMRQPNTSMRNYSFRIWLTQEKMSDAGGNFISDKFKQFCKNQTTGQAVSSSYHHQSNGQVE